MRLGRATEQRLQGSMESALAEVIGTDKPARLMQASEQAMMPPGLADGALKCPLNMNA